MKKWIFAFIILFCFGILFCINFMSLSKSKKLNLMSQTEQNYFVCSTDRYSAEFFSGTREDNFMYDGISNNKLCYGIIKITFNIDQNFANSIKCMFCLNDGVLEYFLAKNPFENCFMCDIQKIVKSDDKIKILIDGIDNTFNEYVCVSKDWKIDYTNALKISFRVFNDYIKNNSKNGKSCECYLKIEVLDYTKEKSYFWSFFVKTNTTEYKSLVIDVLSGEILSKN